MKNLEWLNKMISNLLETNRILWKQTVTLFCTRQKKMYIINFAKKYISRGKKLMPVGAQKIRSIWSDITAVAKTFGFLCNLPCHQRCWRTDHIGQTPKSVYKVSTLMGWQTSHGHKRWIFVDKIGKFLWTPLVNSLGHFGYLFDNNEKNYTIIKQYPNLNLT